MSENSPFKAGASVLPETQVLLAGQDLLTGLSSRAGMEAQFKLAVARARRSGTRFAVGVINVDVEREAPAGQVSGHDPRVVDAAQRVRSTLRETDVIARLGETRFGFLSEEIDQAGVAAITARLAQAMNAVARPGDRGRPAIGIAVWEREEQTLAALLRAADNTLAQARERGSYALDSADVAVPGAVARFGRASRPTRARQAARRLLGWVSLVALLVLAGLALPPEWRDRLLPARAAVEQALSEVQAFAERVTAEARQRWPWTPTER